MASTANIMHKGLGDRIFDGINNTLLVFLGFSMLFPFYVVLINSISPPEDFRFKSIILFPSKIELAYYQTVFSVGSRIFQAFSVTLFITFVGTAVNMVLTLMGAYAMSQKKMPMRSGITLFIVFTMYFSGGMIPTYLVVKEIGLTNTLWAMIIPSAVSSGTLIFMRNFIMGIPAEIIESATIDGCSDLRVLLNIILPLSSAAIATFTLFYAVGHWNEFYAGVIYVTKQKLQPLQVYLRWVLYDATTTNDFSEIERYLNDGIKPPTEALRAATIMAATLPIVLVYPFLQKYFVKGMIMGSLKG